MLLAHLHGQKRYNLQPFQMASKATGSAALHGQYSYSLQPHYMASTGTASLQPLYMASTGTEFNFLTMTSKGTASTVLHDQ